MKSQSGAEILLHPDHLRHHHQYRGRHEVDMQPPTREINSSSQPPLKADARRHRGIHREARKVRYG